MPLSVEAASVWKKCRNVGEGCWSFGFRPSKRHLDPYGAVWECLLVGFRTPELEAKDLQLKGFSMFLGAAL